MTFAVEMAEHVDIVIKIGFWPGVAAAALALWTVQGQWLPLILIPRRDIFFLLMSRWRLSILTVVFLGHI